jgi:folate-binding protein YgfZ
MISESTFLSDYETLRHGCGLVDRSERGKLALSGPDAGKFLQGQVSNDIHRLSQGHGLYATFLTSKGKILGDLRVLDTGLELLLDTERVALQPLFNMIRRYSLGYELELQKRTLECGLLSLLGPTSEDVLAAALLPGSELPETREHDHLLGRIGLADVRLVRTDQGIDLLCDSADTLVVRAELLAAGAVAVCDEAADCIRIESGRPRYGVDLDETVIPQEALLNERAVSFTKGCYVGQETVARLYYKGKPNRQLRGLRAGSALHPGDVLGFEERAVATVTSAIVSPALGPIGLALVRREAPPGTIVASTDGTKAQVVELPFA